MPQPEGQRGYDDRLSDRTLQECMEQIAAEKNFLDKSDAEHAQYVKHRLHRFKAKGNSVP